MNDQPRFPASWPTPRQILVDARAFQDTRSRADLSATQGRIVLSAFRAIKWKGPPPRLIGLVDAAFPPLGSHCAALFDETSQAPQKMGGDATWLLSLSPLCHDPLWLHRLIRDTRIRTIALCTDVSILSDLDRLNDQIARAHFTAAVAWLAAYDGIATVSSDGKAMLEQALGPRSPAVFVVSTAPRSTFAAKADGAHRSLSNRSGILALGAGDPRGCIETVLQAHAQSMSPEAPPVPLVIRERLTWERRAQLRTAYAQAGGQPLNLIFHDSEPTRDDLDAAFLTIPCARGARSILPAIESAAVGTPVLAPNYPALREVICHDAHRFDPNETAALRSLMERAIQRRDVWVRLRDEQSEVAGAFTEDALAQRFLEGIYAASRAPLAIPSRIGTARPQIAVLTPLPPSRSGVADFSASTLASLAHHADVHVFTDTASPQVNQAYRSVSPVSQAYAMRGLFDATVSVLGNSSYHLPIFQFLLDRGGAAIAHDARMLHFYLGCLGIDRTLRVALAEGQRDADEASVRRWLRSQDALPILFLSEIAAAAEPLLVHSRLTAELIAQRYQVTPAVLPFAQYRHMPAVEKRRRTSKSSVSLATFGYVNDDKAPDTIIMAVELLRRWGVDAHMTFCGFAAPDVGERLTSLAAELNVGDAIAFSSSFLSEDEYRDRLADADIGIQLRTYQMGGLSGALCDCISAALPTVANEHLARAMEAPPFVRTIPDNIVPVDIAEAILDILRSGDHERRPLEASSAYGSDHSCDRYARLLLRHLGFAVEMPDAVSCVA